MISYLFLIFGIFLLLAGTKPVQSATKIIFNGPATAQLKYASVTQAASTFGKQKQASTPDGLIRDLYKIHAKDAGSIVQGRNRAILDKFFSKNLAELIWKDIRSRGEGAGVIDFDIFYNTQDPAVSNLVVNAPKITSAKASVSVSFRNARAKQSVKYLLVKQNSGRKIFDIQYERGQTLVKYFEES